MKIDSEEAKKLFESCSYVLDMKNVLKVIKSEDVYDDEAKKNNKNVLTFFQHIKSAYDNMSEVQKQSVLPEMLNKLKKYSSKAYHKANRGSIVDDESTQDHDEESQGGDEADDSEEDISYEEMLSDKKKLEELKKTYEVRNFGLNKKKYDNVTTQICDMKEATNALRLENCELRNEMGDLKKGNDKAIDGLKKENEKIMNILEVIVKGSNESISKESKELLKNGMSHKFSFLF